MSASRILRGSVFPLGVAALSWQYAQYKQYTLSMPQADSVTKSLCTFPANNPSEDRSLYYKKGNMRIVGVFDGHGGWNVSNYLHNNLADVLVKHLDTFSQSSSLSTADEIETSVLKTFTELEENYIDKIRPAYELGFGGTDTLRTH